MSRQAVTKHLLVHYLNLVPIRQIADRWITKYAAPWVGALADLKNQLEEKER
jgi:hypothetical protein